MQLETYYNLSYTIVSLVFLSPLLGYTLAAFLNHRIHSTMGQRGVALIGPTCHLIAYVVNCTHPPYPVLVVSFIFAGFGNGLEDAAWNAWIGNMANANELLGLLHGVYGVGAVLSPLIATSMIARANLPWYFYYYVMVSYSSLSLNDRLFSGFLRLGVPSSSLWFAVLSSGEARAQCSVQRTPTQSEIIKRAVLKMPYSSDRRLE